MIASPAPNLSLVSCLRNTRYFSTSVIRDRAKSRAPRRSEVVIQFPGRAGREISSGPNAWVTTTQRSQNEEAMCSCWMARKLIQKQEHENAWTGNAATATCVHGVSFVGFSARRGHVAAMEVDSARMWAVTEI
jgi:hypothetical protein